MLKYITTDLSTSIRTSVHADPTFHYERSCLDDPAWVYMTLSFSASRLESITRGQNHESLHLLGKSISALNNSLLIASKWTRPSIIATVACLANVEVDELTHRYLLRLLIFK